MAAPVQIEKWYCMTPMQVAQELGVDPARGLSALEARARLQKYGPNLLDTDKKGLRSKRWAHFIQHAVPLTLLAAALLSLLFSRDVLPSLILACLALITIFVEIDLGSQATTIASLGERLEERIRVRREGQIIEIDAEKVVPGDIVLMPAGTRVPADGRLHIAARLNIDEAILSGGSSSTWKDVGVIETAQARLGDRTNMVFKNTAVTHGYGVMIVTSTGMRTESGRMIERIIQRERDRKPLHKQRRQVTFDIAGVVFTPVICCMRKIKGLGIRRDYAAFREV